MKLGWVHDPQEIAQDGFCQSSCRQIYRPTVGAYTWESWDDTWGWNSLLVSLQTKRCQIHVGSPGLPRSHIYKRWNDGVPVIIPWFNIILLWCDGVIRMYSDWRSCPSIDLLRLADQYLVGDLYRYCVNFMERYLCRGHAVERFLFSDSRDGLRELCDVQKVPSNPVANYEKLSRRSSQRLLKRLPTRTYRRSWSMELRD